MSLINKMLQDLDARGGAGPRGPDPAVRPVGPPPRNSHVLIAAGAGAGVLVAAMAGVAWYFLHTVPVPVPVPLKAPAPPVATVAAPATPVEAAAAAPVAPAAVAEPVAAAAAPLEIAPQLASQASPPVPPQVSPPVPPQASSPVPPRARRAAADGGPREPVRAAPEHDAGRSAVVPDPPQGSQPQAENAYRRALAALQDGRRDTGIAGLEQAVYLYPRHEAARQTLVGLLLENGRNDEATRHMQLGLGLNPNQPQMAMLLARLQLDRNGQGAAAVETLRRSLPFAAGSADYLGFLAGALQRQGRNREAVEQYEAALRLAPQNGIWWMGLGISLQAERRDGEARTAFGRARQAGLTPELQGYVERKLGQLQ